MTTSTSGGFADLGLDAPVLKAITEVGYEQPSPIQAQSIPVLISGSDLLGIAQTGTGKTAAFALPLLSRVDVSVKAPQILVLAPTRELAIQVAEAFQRYASHIKGFQVLPIYGGGDMGGQLRHLKRGAHAVIGTPGRIMDHLKRGTLKLNQLQAVVLDEADEMLRMGFIDDVNWILDQTPSRRQVALFSATMPPAIQKVTEKYLNNPQVVKIKSETRTVETVAQFFIEMPQREKLDALTRVLEVEPFTGVIVFARTKTATAELAEKLEARGYAAAALNGDMSQQLRERAIGRLKSQKLEIIVATDVAARGIDVATVSHVINYDIPYDTEAYIHRIGRTGRAGRNGKAILFITPRERRMLQSIQRATRQSISRFKLPSRQDVANERVKQFKQGISDIVEQQDLDFFQDLVHEYCNETLVSAEQVAAALTFMAQKDRPLKAPPEKQSRRSDRDEQPAHKDRSHKDRPKKRRRGADEDIDWITYRLEVGSDHGATAKDIVGAIANEAGMDSAYIGRINLYQDHSTVELPDGMPKDIHQHLRKTRVRQQPMLLERIDGKKVSSKGKRKTAPVPRKKKSATPAKDKKTKNKKTKEKKNK